MSPECLHKSCSHVSCFMLHTLAVWSSEQEANRVPEGSHLTVFTPFCGRREGGREGGRREERKRTLFIQPHSYTHTHTHVHIHIHTRGLPEG